VLKRGGPQQEHSQYAGEDLVFLSALDAKRASLLRLKSEMWLFYRRKSTADARFRESGSQVWNLTLGMLGSAQHPVLNAKAKETHCLLDFAVDQLEVHAPLLGELDAEHKTRFEMLLLAGREAQRFDRILHEQPRHIKPETQRDLMLAFRSHCAFFERAGAEMKPKHHVMCHCIRRAHTLGNPQHYHTYRDESLNGTAKI
jgi:hypothetical protein